MKITTIKHRLRLFLIRSGAIKPKNLTESREAFPFPYAVRNYHVKGVGISRHIEALHYVHKKG